MKNMSRRHSLNVTMNFDEVVKSQKRGVYVIPAKAGIQLSQEVIDVGAHPA
jgi:hypothetical protein